MEPFPIKEIIFTRNISNDDRGKKEKKIYINIAKFLELFSSKSFVPFSFEAYIISTFFVCKIVWKGECGEWKK